MHTNDTDYGRIVLACQVPRSGTIRYHVVPAPKRLTRVLISTDAALVYQTTDEDIPNI